MAGLFDHNNMLIPYLSFFFGVVFLEWFDIVLAYWCASAFGILLDGYFDEIFYGI